MTTVESHAFFVRDGSLLRPSALASGPWDPDSMHGRLLVGLCGQEIERVQAGEAFHFARLTVDLFRLPPLEPVEVTTEVVREGNRIRVVDATAICGGIEMARARCVMLRRGDQPPGDVWSPPDWDAPPPEQVTRRREMLGNKWEVRLISGVNEDGFSGVARKQIWMRELRQLVEGENLTPFVRAALAADYASPLANSGSDGLHFVNADATLYLHRLPVGEWIGMEVASHQSSDGIAVGDTNLYDEGGAIGRSTVCAVVNRRLRS